MNESKTYIKVGLLVGGAMAVLALLIFFISEEQNLFLKMNRYTIRFSTVEGLDVGNPVKLNGVRVGRIRDIRLPLDPEESKITIFIDINKKYSNLIRAESRARIRSLGLLGDKYIEITAGSPDSPCISPEGLIPSTEPTDIARLLRRGEDTMDNLLAISTSLRHILDQVSSGDSALHDVANKAVGSLERLDRILSKLEQNRGTLGRLINDEEVADAMFENIEASSHNLKKITDTLVADLTQEGTVWDHLTRNPEAGERALSMINNLSDISHSLAQIGKHLQMEEGALLPRLLTDEQYASKVLNDLQSTARSLRSISEKLDKGQGTAGRLINDPTVYEGIENVLYGINKSRFLKWLIRHNRKKGEEGYGQ